MANIPTRCLRLLVKRGHAMLAGEIARQMPGVKDPHAIHQAMEKLQAAGCITWTTQGWLATDTGRNYVRVNVRLLFDAKRRTA